MPIPVFALIFSHAGKLRGKALVPLAGIVLVAGCAVPGGEDQTRRTLHRYVEMQDETDESVRKRIIRSVSKIEARYGNGYVDEYVESNRVRHRGAIGDDVLQISSEAVLEPGKPVRYVLTTRMVSGVDLASIDLRGACSQLRVVADERNLDLPRKENGIRTYGTTVDGYLYSEIVGVVHATNPRFVLLVDYQATPAQMQQLAAAQKMEYRPSNPCLGGDQVATDDEMAGIAEVYRRSLQ